MTAMDASNFREALRLLGKHDHAIVDRVDAIVGGVILAAGVASFVGPVAAPAAAFAAIWGWVDQKNEATNLLRRALDAVVARRKRTSGFERTQLLAAAHTVLVVSSVFDVVRERLTDNKFNDLDLSFREKRYLTTGQDAVETLYGSTFPMPSSTHGFRENIARVEASQGKVAERICKFLRGLEAFKNFRFNPGEIAESAALRYQSRYFELAGQVPEFMIWAILGEEDANRTLARANHKELLSLIKAHSVAFSRLECLLTEITSVVEPRKPSDLTEIVRRAAVAELEEPVISPSVSLSRESEIKFPSIQKSYIEPNYRIASYDRDSHVASEFWWRQIPVHADLDIRLAGFFFNPEAAKIPLLLLGHPGAGKSMLTKVLAARLPNSNFTGVYVPLRHVTADAPIHRQIHEALENSTNGRVSWHEFSDKSADALRVVILDGLDELLQASEHNRTTFLHEVAEFQRRESDQDRPVAVIVTSRIVVADRVQIPVGTPIIKLEDFSDEQISEWRSTWNSSNKREIEGGKVRAVTQEAIEASGVLARQPLLLLLIALYSADPAAPPIERGISDTMLYGRLMESFALREVDRPAPSQPDAVAVLVSEQIRRLSIAALAMFNRGRQHVLDIELGEDLAALQMSDHARPEMAGNELVAQFFFIHTSQTNVINGQHPRRSYEFLHATFGEYLVAREIVEVLLEAGNGLTGKRRNRDPDDALLFALLAHQCLAGRRSVLSFTSDLMAELSVAHREEVLAVLRRVIHTFRSRHGSDRYVNYLPVQIDHVRELAAYSSNLILLLLAGSKGRVKLSEIWEDDAGERQWHSALSLWRSGLDDGGWNAFLSTIRRHGSWLRMSDSNRVDSDGYSELMSAKLMGDRTLIRTLEMGMEVRRSRGYREILKDDRKEEIARWIVPYVTMSGRLNSGMTPSRLGALFRELGGDLRGLENPLIELLTRYHGDLPTEIVKLVADVIMSIKNVSHYSVFRAMIDGPALAKAAPGIIDPANYEGTDILKILTFRSEQRRRRQHESPELKAFYDALEVLWRDSMSK
ncbi:NACHT domain-containing protein [Amycolatopsis sp. lyj-346]|uniref:NACHT domain-containing protein n=1 Tax=Amycolatopsis sp. lyj-346 TaxID=2789289 RepID=UPI003978064A